MPLSLSILRNSRLCQLIRHSCTAYRLININNNNKLSHTAQRHSTKTRSTTIFFRSMSTELNESIQPTFDARLQKAWDRGIQTGEVVYEQATSNLIMEGSIPFEARYLPCLDKKPTSRSPSPEPESKENGGIGEQCEAIERDPGPRKESTSQADPFAAPRDNVVLELENYTCVLNKYALEEGHFLVVTNDFYPQNGLLRACDLEMIHATLTRPKDRHYCFFNGGVLAGASQEHRHFQFLPVPELQAPCWPDQIYHNDTQTTTIASHPDIPAHHFLLPILDSTTASLFKTFERLHEAAQEAVGSTDPDMPYNFLMTTEYMLLFPRRNEEWDEHEIGVGGTCLIGSIMVSKEKDLKVVEKLGIRQMLAYVGFPTKTDEER